MYKNIKKVFSQFNRTPYIGQAVIRKEYRNNGVVAGTAGIIRRIEPSISVDWDNCMIQNNYTIDNKDLYLEFL